MIKDSLKLYSMPIIKLGATESTNSYLKERHKNHDLPDFTVVMAHDQTKGRGQFKNSWHTQPGKNLTFSMLKLFPDFSATYVFYINAMVSLAIFDVLQQHKIPGLTIKWPNDIMAGRQKICGILIENSLAGQQIRATIIGVGLNVNQTNFPQGLNATSMKLEVGQVFSLDHLLQQLVTRLKYYLDGILEKGPWQEGVFTKYNAVLFGKGTVSNFKNGQGRLFKGMILGVTNGGLLCVQMENGSVERFYLKQIKLVL